MSSDAERYEERNPLAPGTPVAEGFQDPSGTYPRIDSFGKSDVSPASVGKSKSINPNLGTRAARVSSSVPQTKSQIIGKSKSTRNPQYPKNNSINTASGHLIEYDDTPGFERINFQHRTGSKVEMLSNGDMEIHSSGSKYTIIAGDDHAVIRGCVVIVTESNANIRVQGNADIEVDGDLNQLIQGNHNLEIQGDQNIRVHGNVREQITGSKLEETRGNIIRRNLSNVRERTVGNTAQEIGGSFKLTAEGSYTIAAYGEVQMTYFGGLITLNGENKEGTKGEGELVYHTSYSSFANTDTLNVSDNVNVEGSVLVSENVHAEGNMRAPRMDADVFEGLATRSRFANSAARAPMGPATPVMPEPRDPNSPEAREDAPDSNESVEDVTGTSDQFIINLDRSVIHDYGTRILNTSEVTSRCRNPNLLSDSVWLRDQVDTGAVLESIISLPNVSPKRSGKLSTNSTGTSSIGSTFGQAAFNSNPGNVINFTIPEFMKITSGPSLNTKLSPNFMLSHLTGGDSESSTLKAQEGLSPVQISQNMQMLSYTVLERLRSQFMDRWTISEGLYNPYENETISPGCPNDFFARGLGVGIQFPDIMKSHYFDVAQWCANNLIYESIILSYIDYDPTEINEPTLIITIKSGSNSKMLSTEVNHRQIGSQLMDLSDES